DQHIAVPELEPVVGLVRPTQILGLLGEAIVLRRRAEELAEGRRYLVQVDAVLRALRTGERRLDGREIELHLLRIVDLALARNAEQALRLEVFGEARHRFVRAPGAAQIADGLLIHREEAHGRAVFR